MFARTIETQTKQFRDDASHYANLLTETLFGYSEAEIEALERDIERFENTGKSSPGILRVFAALHRATAPMAA